MQPVSAGPASVPASLIGCSPRVYTADPTTFEMMNTTKPSNFIMAEVVNGELAFVVQNLPRTSPRSGCPGWWLFTQMMDHFGALRTAINVILGTWTHGDNLATVNRLTVGPTALGIEEAARHTLTAAYAASRNFTNVIVVSADGSPGKYTRVNVRFTK